MVTLTSLLVLAALFTQTSQSIPKTAYLKLIDVWYIVLIIIDFLIIISVVIIENIRLSTSNIASPGISMVKISPSESKNVYTKRKLAIQVNKICKIIFPVFILIFLSVIATLAQGW